MIIFCSFLMIEGCSHPKIRVDETCLTCIKSQRLSCTGPECPSTFKAGDNYLVTMTETGENFYIAPILMEEKMTVQEGIPVAMAKLNGRYFLIGENFANLWMLQYSDFNLLRYIPVKLPKDKIAAPVFEIYNNRLLLRGTNYPDGIILNADDEKWESISDLQPKKGEK